MAPLRTLLLLLGLVSISRAEELTTLDGKKSKGEIVSIDAKELTFKTTAGEQKHELTKLAAVDFAAPKSPAPGVKWIEVEMVDGSHFRCSDFKVKGKTAALSLLGADQTIEVPFAAILYMIRDVSDPKLNQAFRGFLSKRGKRDVWIIQKGESLDAIPGTFGDGDDKGEIVSFEIEATGDKRSIQLGRVYGMILNPAGMDVAQTVCRVVDAFDNVLFAKAVQVTNKKSVVVDTVLGVRVELPNMAAVSKLDFSAGALNYLSDLVPEKVEISSTDGVAEPYRRDRNLDNEDLKIDGVKYAKGLALHSRTVLTYNIGGRYKLFQALAGVDDSVEGDSKSTLTIEGDQKNLFSGVIKKGDKAKLLNLTVLNVKELRITVESDFLDLGNQVDLVSAKVLK